jgi:hypothetical protein
MTEPSKVVPVEVFVKLAEQYERDSGQKMIGTDWYERTIAAAPHEDAQTPPQGGGEALSSVIDEMTCIANLVERGEACMVVDRIRHQRDRLAALKPQTPDVLGEASRAVAWIVDWKHKPQDGYKAGGGSEIIRNQYAAVEEKVARLSGLAWVESVTVTPLAPIATPPGDVLGGEGEAISVLRKLRALDPYETLGAWWPEIDLVLATRPSQSDEGETP